MNKNMYIFIILSFVGVLYSKYMKKMDSKKEINNYKLINKYLLKKNKKPLLWIHLNNEYNSRDWSSFYSRGNYNVNIPFIHLTIQSIIKNCGDDFYICIIDDTSFSELLPNWTANLSKIGAPLKDKMRYLGMVSLLEQYGGVIMPNSFLSFKSIKPLYYKSVNENKPLVFENSNSYNYNNNHNFFPDCTFMIAPPNNEVITDFKEFLIHSVSKDYTAESLFLNENNKWCNLRCNENKIMFVDGQHIGAKNIHNTEITINNIVQEGNLDIAENAYGLLIPTTKLLNSTNFQWFCYLNENELLNSNMYISNYF